MLEQRVEKLKKIGYDHIGIGIKEGHCVFCGEEVPKGQFCYCKKSEKRNMQAKKLLELLDRYAYVTDFNENVRIQLNCADFPKKFAGMKFSDYVIETDEQKNNLQLTKDYVKNALNHYLDGTNLIFLGNFGNGKTMLMSIAGDEIIRQFGIQVKYVNVNDLSDKLKKSFDDKNISTAKIVDEYKKSPILILDDIDKITPKDWTCELMYGLSNYRSEHKLPTWVNANNSMEELEKKYYGEGTMSRFFENSIKAKFTGPNWRLRERGINAI